MTHPAPTPTPADVQALLDTLAAERESLRALVEGAPGEATIELVDAVDRIAPQTAAEGHRDESPPRG